MRRKEEGAVIIENEAGKMGVAAGFLNARALLVISVFWRAREIEPYHATSRSESFYRLVGVFPRV